MLGIWITPQLLFNGIVQGLVYGLVAMGIVLIYRSTRVINFAVGNMGLIGSVTFALMIINYDFPFWVAFALAILIGALVGGFLELTVVRRLFAAPRVILVVATVGIAQLAQAVIRALPEIDAEGERYPVAVGTEWEGVLSSVSLSQNQVAVVGAVPLAIAVIGILLTDTRRGKALVAEWSRTRTWISVVAGVVAVATVLLFVFSDAETTRGGGIDVAGTDLSTLVVVPLIAVGLGLLLNRTTFGKAVAASANNPDLARLSGVNPKVVSTFVWIVAGVLSTLSIILLSGGTSVAGLENLGPITLTRAMVAAVLAGMVSFPRAVLAGVYIGVAEAVLRFNYFNDPGLIDFVIFLFVVVAVLFQSRAGGDEGVFAFVPKVRPVPESLREVWWVRNLSRIVIGFGLALAILLPATHQWLPLLDIPASRQLLYTSIVCFAICAASLTVITGWSGQLSLSQMTFAGLGALSASAFDRGLQMDVWFIDFVAPEMPFLVAILLGALLASAIAALVGVGALRVKGLLLAVSTFVFALGAQSYLYRRPFFSGDNTARVPFERGELFGMDLQTERRYYYVCLVALCAVILVLARLRRSGVGRSTIAVRDNPDTAAAYTVSPTRMKVSAFALAGGIAGLGGGLLAGLVQNVPFTERFFLVGDSLQLVGMVVIGGVGSVIGPVLGALWVIGLPAFFPDNDVVPLFGSSIGLLIIVMYFPGGLVQIGYSARAALLDWYIERRGEPEVAPSTTTPPASLRKTTADTTPDVVLATRGVSVRFGGNVALNNMTMQVNANEIVGLIGTNGAGKSTFMNAVGGYVPSTGNVELFGRDISSSSPAARARAGLGRTFQAATLFPELTVRETVQVALEARGRTPFLTTALFLPPSGSIERRRRAEADELIAFLGLGRYADSFISDLSTGTRRIVELAGLLALDAQVLCLDEPTAGVAQRETEAFGPLLVSINRELGSSMLIIEHDMPLIMSMSDRVYCLEAGTVIAEGLPDDVRYDPAVVASYLGTDERAIARSDSA